MDSRDLARALRDDPPELDDIRRARMERNLLEEASVRGETRVATSRRRVLLGVVAVAAAAAIVAWVQPWRVETVLAPEAQVSFEALRDGVPVRSGTFAEGESLQTATDQLLRVRFGGSVVGSPNTLVELEPSTRVRFSSVLGDARELELERGHVRIEFHPDRRGEESLAIQTPTARIEVVGTIFEVEVDDQQVTRVTVQQGAVRVIPLEGPTTILRAGESRSVGMAMQPATHTETRTDELDELHAEISVQTREGDPVAGSDSYPRDEGDEDVEPIEGVESEEAPVDSLLSEDARFDLASRYLAQGRFSAARHELRAIARTSGSRSSRARAWTEIAQIYEAENEPAQAAEAYRRAADAGRGTIMGTNALFALGRMRSSMSDAEAAKVAYRRYLQEAPEGPLARQARRALCRLGETAQCGE